jgi:opacity protein-like surface antigen
MNRKCKRALELFAVAALLLRPERALAQAATGAAPDPGEDRPLESAWSLGLGAGIVQPDIQSETYWSANLRRQLGPRTERGDATAPNSGLKAFLEGEVGYWKGEAATTKDKDLLVGLNLIGAVPTKVVDLYLGVGFGAHFVDETFTVGSQVVDQSETRFGGNAQFGVEVKATEHVGVFGNGRLDFLSGSNRNRQYNKIWGGIRFHF